MMTKKRSENSADEKASTVMFTTVGQKNFWTPARNVYPVIPHAKPHLMKLKHFVQK